jgi:hypothetical protein
VLIGQRKKIANYEGVKIALSKLDKRIISHELALSSWLPPGHVANPVAAQILVSAGFSSLPSSPK